MYDYDRGSRASNMYMSTHAPPPLSSETPSSLYQRRPFVANLLRTKAFCCSNLNFFFGHWGEGRELQEEFSPTDTMHRRRASVGAAVLLLVLLLCGNLLLSDRSGGGQHVREAERCGGYTTPGWIETLPLLAVFGGRRKPPATQLEAGAGRFGTGGSGGERHPPMAANLSRCHWSLTDADVSVYCCPPRKDADQTVVDFKLPDTTSSPRRIRRRVRSVAADADYLAKYERAVAIMKSLPSDHPHNFLRQANNHCLYCTGSYDQVNSTALFKIHRSWFFFPWHRAFVYFHERILGKLIGDDTFALPYWNWDAPEGMVIPDFYTKGALNNSQRDHSHLPPQVVDINYYEIESGLSPEDQVATNLAFMYHQMVSGARKAELFMGCKMRAGEEGVCDGPGTIEEAPHNTVHTWVGSRLNPERENMGAFYSAARDPIFYAHHTNIDRLWTVWKTKLQGHEPEFTDPDWLDTAFTFYDENLQFVRIRVRDVLDIAKLGYTYEQTDLPWRDARPKPAVPPEVARAMLKKREEEINGRIIRMPGSSDEHQQHLLYPSSEFGPQGRVLDTTIRARVQRPKKDRAEEEEEVLVVYGIDVKRDTYVKFDVFVNLVDVEEPSLLATVGPRAREFAGAFVNARSGARRADGSERKKMKATLKLGISELLRDLGAEGDDSVWVSLVPRGGTGVVVAVDGVRIEYIR